MRVLLTNDDGIHAPGIRALRGALLGGATPLGDPLWTVAPATVQSATSHGVTFHEPLMARPTRIGDDGGEGVAVSGRPADCVKLAVSALWSERFGAPSKPDLAVSGMNSGANVGINVIYSGTVAAALEAAFLGIPSIAVSLHMGPGRPLWDVAARHARAAIDRVMETGLLQPGTCVNINVPRCEAAEPGDAPLYEYEPGNPRVGDHDPEAEMPIAVCPMNTHGLVDAYERRESPSGDRYYWPAGGGLDFHATDVGTDVERLFARCVTVTPLHHDLTASGASVDAWRSALGC